MARVRYVKSLDEVKKSAEVNPEFLKSSVRSVRCAYETDPGIARAVVPKPLEPASDAEVRVTFSHVAMHVSPELTIEIGSTIFGVKCHYDGVEGTYLITMPMTTEQAVVPGRETYGEPKKIAQIDFQKEGDRVRFATQRMGLTYLSAEGTLGEALGPRDFIEHGYCFKAFPSCEKGKHFDQDPLLVRLEWRHQNDKVWRLDGSVELGESPFDPVADLPVRRILRLEYEEGSTQSNGKVLRPVPGEWLLPFMHQRYDDPAARGIEV